MFRQWLLGIVFSVVALHLSPVAADDWPQWRGPNRDDVSQEKGLLSQWPDGGPDRLWLFTGAGLGYSGMSIVGDTLYTMGAREDQEFLIAVDVIRGAEKWSVPVGAIYKEGHGDGPRGTPTVDSDRVYALSGNGTLACVAAADGKLKWKVEMTALGGRRPGWGYCESVLVDGDQVVCLPGGSNGAVAALDKQTGEVKWQSKDYTEGAQYSSLIAIEHNGKRQYVALTQKKVAGIDAASGDVLWTSDWHGKTAVVTTPIFHDGHVYIASGYGEGCKLIKLEADGSATDVYDNKTMVNHHGGVVRIRNHLYGYSDGKGWVCQDFLGGDIVWNERQKMGKGSLTYADGRLYLLDEKKGTVALIAASPAGYEEHGRFVLEPQSQQRNPRGAVWTHPVVANGKLYIRDQDHLFCFDIRRELAGGQ